MNDPAMVDFAKAIEANPREADVFNYRRGTRFDKGNLQQVSDERKL